MRGTIALLLGDKRPCYKKVSHLINTTQPLYPKLGGHIELSLCKSLYSIIEYI